jgi:DNA adenine methylase
LSNLELITPKVKVTIPSIIKWTGSKRKQANTIQAVIPEYDRYIEPFLGGGALLFLNGHKKAIASDIYQPLINLWGLVKNNPTDLISNYTSQWEMLQEDLPDYYYIARKRFNDQPNPYDLNFLLRTCVNGIVRFNEKGEFNNSFHLSRKGMMPKLFQKNVMAWHEKLSNVDFYCRDYQDILSGTKKGDFVYFDPPYAGSNNRYISNLDVNLFLENLEKLNLKGIKWALSFDGTRGEEDLSYYIPESLYKRKHLVSNGHSAVHRVLNGPLDEVFETLYLNY